MENYKNYVNERMENIYESYNSVILEEFKKENGKQHAKMCKNAFLNYLEYKYNTEDVRYEIKGAKTDKEREKIAKKYAKDFEDWKKQGLMYAWLARKEGKYVNKTKSEIAFLFEPLTDSCKDVEDNSKHLFDASVSMSEHAMLKLHFLENAFPLDQTMFLLKNFNTVYQLRLRYAKIDTVDGSNKINAMSNNILRGMKASYDQKYDVAFMNLYKYLNSSLDILEDVTNTELAGLKARSTLIEKGGINK